MASSVPPLQAVTFVLTRFTIQKNLEVKYDVDLRRLRLESYAELWSRLLPLALFARDGYPTRELLEKLTHSLTHWYFGKGGLYLSEHPRDAYFRLQRALHDLLESAHWSEPTNQLDPETFEHLRSIGSRLRTRMTMDVGTRKPFMFDPKAEQAEVSTARHDDSTDPDEGWILQWVRVTQDQRA